MRYKVVSRTSAGVDGWAIEDRQLTPALREAGVTPAVCSLDGKTPLTFETMTGAFRWLATCERAGLDMGGEPGMFRVYTDATGRGGLAVSKHGGEGPTVREIPATWWAEQ